MWSVGVILILIFFNVLKHSFPCLHLLAMFHIGHNWTQPVLSEAAFFCWFCSSNIPTYCLSTLTFCKGGAIIQSADTADANADTDEDVDVVLESFCFSCPPTIVDEQCKLNLIVGVLIWKKWRVLQPISGWCCHFGPMCKWLAFIWNDNMSFFQQRLLIYRGIQYAYFWVI